MLLLVALLICHYVADFVATTPGMLSAKATGRPLLPIACHAALHAMLMMVCIVVAGTGLWMCLALGVIEWVTHLVIDTVKGRLNARHPSLADVGNRNYWTVFGLDQLLHLLVIVGICRLAL